MEYRKFGAALSHVRRGPLPPKAAKPPKVPRESNRSTLDDLAALGGERTEAEKFVTPGSIPESKAANRNEAEEERAAIIEHEGTIPRECAEGFAWLGVDRPPTDVPPRR